MDIKEVAVLLAWNRASVLAAIEEGVELPKSGTKLKLHADRDGSILQVSEAELQEFLDAFEHEEPGRWPPVSVRRELRVEAQHKCGICRADLPLQFHHILEWSELRHHDPHHMLAICGGCHDKIRTGQIDRTEQRKYKIKLEDWHEVRQKARPQSSALEAWSSPVAWDDLRDVVLLLNEGMLDDSHSAESQFDFQFVDLDEKNRLNRLGADTFAVMVEVDEPFFGRIRAFLEAPRNSDITIKYHEVVDEIRREVAATQVSADAFDAILNTIYATMTAQFPSQLKGRRRTLRAVLSFMYCNCDIGRKA